MVLQRSICANINHCHSWRVIPYNFMLTPTTQQWPSTSQHWSHFTGRTRCTLTLRGTAVLASSNESAVALPRRGASQWRLQPRLMVLQSILWTCNHNIVSLFAKTIMCPVPSTLQTTFHRAWIKQWQAHGIGTTQWPFVRKTGTLQRSSHHGGAHRYKVAPQGILASGDGYNHLMWSITVSFSTNWAHMA